MTEIQRPNAEEILEVTKAVEDPELRMSITELGLIYGVAVDDEGITLFTVVGCRAITQAIGPSRYHNASLLVEQGIGWFARWGSRRWVWTGRWREGGQHSHYPLPMTGLLIISRHLFDKGGTGLGIDQPIKFANGHPTC